MWHEIKKIKSGKKELREFGLTIGVALFIFGGIALWRGKTIYPYFFAFGVIFITFALAAPKVLKPLQKAWIAFSLVLGFFMSRVILTVLFYLVVTPMGLITRIMGKDILDQRIQKERPSYWNYRRDEAKSKESYLNQY